MTWIFFALGAALFTALKGAAGKKSMRSLDEYVVSFFTFLLPGIFITAAFMAAGVPPLGDDFWPVFFVDCVLSAVATILSSKALLSDLSTTIPMMAFTPLFMLVTSYLILGEYPDRSGVVGVVLIVAGAYLLNIRERKNGWKAPFRVIVKNDGPRLMLAASFIWSITGNLDKIAVTNSSPFFFPMAECFFVALLILPFAWKSLMRSRDLISKERYHLLAIGLFSALMTICQMIAITMTLAVYAVSIKRLGILISIALGGLVFKENDMKLKLAGGCVMVAGVFLITVL